VAWVANRLMIDAQAANVCEGQEPAARSCEALRYARCLLVSQLKDSCDIPSP
jgi:hypothetical protein